MSCSDYTSAGDADATFNNTEIRLAKTFARTPCEVLVDTNLSIEARFCYTLLTKYAGESNAVYPGQETLANLMKRSVTSVKSYIDELRLAGLITIKRRGLGLTNLYILTVFVESLEGFHTINRDGKEVPNLRQSAHRLSDSQPTGYQESKPTGYKYDKPKTKRTTDDKNEENNARTREISPQRSAPTPPKNETKREAANAVVEAQRGKVDAFHRALGVDPETRVLPETRLKESHLFASIPIPVDDIVPLVTYILSDPWWTEDKLSVKVLLERWPMWEKHGKPDSQENGKRSNQPAYNSSRSSRPVF